MTKTLPWDYHPDLTEERLAAIARLIAEGRQTAVELYDEEAGDNGWTLGCRAFQFGRARILRANDNRIFEWLGVIDRSLQLIFTIGEVPIRIYRGEAEEPTERTLRQGHNELRQLGFSFEDLDEGRELAYRFAIETDVDGSVLAIRFVGLRGETALLNYDVAFDGGGDGSGGIGQPATESVELDPPNVAIRVRTARTAD